MMQSPTTEAKDAVMTDAPVPFNKSDFTFLQNFDQTVELMLNSKDQGSVNASVRHLKERIENARRILEDLPGLQFEEEEQERILQREMATLKATKRKLQECLTGEPSQPFVQKEVL